MQKLLDSETSAKTLGEAGVFLRMLGCLPEARACLEEAVKLEPSVVQRIRLAHLYQWQEDFDRSNTMFKELLRHQDSPLADFIWQHAGKNYYDQGRYQEALEAFGKALALRLAKKSPEDQVESTRFSIQETKKRLSSLKN